MTLNGGIALYCSNYASFGARHKNLKDDRPIFNQHGKCSPGTVLSVSIRLMRI